MLTLAVELAAGARLLGPDDWRLTDDALLEALQTRSVGQHQAIGQIVKRLRVGDIFECVAVWKTGDLGRYRELSEALVKRGLERTMDEALARGSGPQLRTNLHLILDHKKTCRSLSFLDLSTGKERTVGHDSRNLLVGVFLTNARASALTASERRRASRVVADVLRWAGLADLVPAPEPLADGPAEDGLFAE